jgi:hypothetical protein
MHEEGHPGFVTVYQELEGIQSLSELVREVYHAVSALLRGAGKLKAAALDVWESLVPQQIKSFDLPRATRAERFVPLAREMFRVIGGFPFYLQHVADRLSQLERPPVVKDVDAAVEDLVLAAEDPGNFNYNVERIKTYYDKRDSDVALAILGAIAAKDRPLGLTALHKAVSLETKGTTTEHVREVCTLLLQDHCLERVAGKKGPVYEFRWPLVKRWWQRHRL